jgi:2'-5' RNA ligase
MDGGIRAFVAIRLSAEVDATVAGFQTTLRGLGREVSWTGSSAFHLTLRFLGNRVPPGQIEQIIDGLGPIARATAPFTLQVHGAGAFPSLNRPRVIWVGLADGPIVDLAAKVEALSLRCGFEPEPRRFTPHLTIGRVRNPTRNPGLTQSLGAAAEQDFGSCRISSMALYRSHLSPRGAAYEALATLNFDG